MSFKTIPGERLRGFATYVSGDYSIAFVHDEADADAVWLCRASLDSALEFGTLTLTARMSDGRVAFPEGYHPKVSWVD